MALPPPIIGFSYGDDSEFASIDKSIRDASHLVTLILDGVATQAGSTIDKCLTTYNSVINSIYAFVDSNNIAKSLVAVEKATQELAECIMESAATSVAGAQVNLPQGISLFNAPAMPVVQPASQPVKATAGKTAGFKPMSTSPYDTNPAPAIADTRCLGYSTAGFEYSVDPYLQFYPGASFSYDDGICKSGGQVRLAFTNGDERFFDYSIKPQWYSATPMPVGSYPWVRFGSDWFPNSRSIQFWSIGITVDGGYQLSVPGTYAFKTVVEAYKWLLDRVAADNCVCTPAVTPISPPPPPPVVVAPVVPPVVAATTDCCRDFVDLQEPTLFFLAQDDAPWRSKLKTFYGDFGDVLLSATSIDDLQNSIPLPSFSMTVINLK